MYYLNLFLLTGYFIVTKNPFKIFVSVIFLLLLYPINNLDSVKVSKKEFFYHDTIGDDNFFLIKYNSEYKVIKSKHFDITIDGEHKMVEYSEDNELLILSWIAFVVSIIILLVGTFNRDTDLNWEMGEVRNKALRKIVKCEIEYENGKEIFSYSLNCRLLCKKPNQIYLYELGKMIEDYIDNPRAFPKYKNTEDRREDKLNEILK
jgi:hypothetical protein